MTGCHYKNKLRASLVFTIFIIGVFFMFIAGEASAQSIKGRPEMEKKHQHEKQLDSLNKLKADSIKQIHKGALTEIITSSCTDSLVYEFGETDTLMILYKEGKVQSSDFELEADYAEMSRRYKTISAHGVPDTAGNVVGKPIFKQGSEEYKMESLAYNYNTKKARIVNVITNQGEGFLHGAVTKRMPDGSSFIKDGMYTTCDHEHPHYYLKMTKGKMVEGSQKKVVFGPSYMVVEDVPFPLVIPFGFFPKLSERSSGIKFPTYGEEVARGFFLEGLGFYLAIGDYMDLDVTGSIYSLGSWSLRTASRYTKRYKYDGGFNLEYNFNVTGEKGSTDYAENKTFSIMWNHTQSPKARPGTTFSANVNFSSVSANQYNNQHNPYTALNNSASSSVSYSKRWDDSPFNFSASLNHSQNMRDSTYAITIPNFTLSVNRIYPFKPKESVGRKKLYEDISFTYSTTFDNKVNFKSSEVGEPDFMKKFNNGMQHRIGITLPSLTLLKYLNFTPNVNYGMSWYFKSKEKYWDPVTNKVAETSTNAFSDFGVTQTYSFSASLDTRLYGMMVFKQGSAIQAIRHIVKPSISFGYTPDQRTRANGYRKYQNGPSINNISEYNIYEGQVYGYPSSAESGSISFSLGNTLEMKVRDRKDTTAKGGSKKISLLDQLNFATSYNLLADSLNLSDITINGSTNILGKLGLSFGAIIDPYAINEYGTKINSFQWAEKGGLNIGRLKSFNTSFGYTFSGGGKKGGEQNQNQQGSNNPPPENNNMSGVPGSQMDMNSGGIQPQHDNAPPVLADPFSYADFSMPWTLTFSYSYNYSKSWNYTNNVLKPNIQHIQTLNFNGSVSPTKNWQLTFGSGFDFRMLKLTTTQIGISRDLHCFNFTFNWVPMGSMQSWSFRIAITSSVLSDIMKYDKRSSPWDR